MVAPKTPLTKAIHAIGMTTADFAKDKLDLTYQTFSYRIRVGHLSLDDYHKICYWTGKSFEELFPNPYKPLLPKAPESVTIPRTTTPAIRRRTLPPPPAGSTPPGKEEQKKEEVPLASSAPSVDEFQIIEMGIPPIQSESESSDLPVIVVTPPAGA